MDGTAHGTKRSRAGRHLRSWADRGWAATRRLLSGNEPERSTALMLVKAAVATVAAWQIAVHLLGSTVPYYAPLAALLVVDRTIERSLWTSARRLVAVVAGALTAWAVGEAVGATWWSVGLVVLVTLAVARLPALGEHGVQITITALFALLTVGGTGESYLGSVVVETLVGGLVGLTVNIVVIPPLQTRTPTRRLAAMIDRFTGLLRRMADALENDWRTAPVEDWRVEVQRIGESVPALRQTVLSGRESSRFNPRMKFTRTHPDWVAMLGLVNTVDRAQWQLAGICRGLAAAHAERFSDDGDGSGPDPQFLVSLATVLRQSADTLDDLEQPTAVDDATRHEHDPAVGLARMSPTQHSPYAREEEEPDSSWRAYAELVTDARRLVSELSQQTDESSPSGTRR